MSSGELIIACVLDAAIGDPRWFPHPVRLMGSVIGWYESRIRMVIRTRAGLRTAGIVLALGLPALTYAIAWLVIALAGRVDAGLTTVLTVLLAWTTLAARDLFDHARLVVNALGVGSLDQAREAVSQIVGRDTDGLSNAEIVRATIETIAESAADGVIAPLFYLALGGPPLALAYKAINTLDSMIGHRDAHYRYFGWASARFDDVANWVPARLTAMLLILAAAIWTRTMRSAWRIVCRDGPKHPSPNSGRPEAAMAGALGVQLGGTNVYGGVATKRPRLGDALMPLVPEHVTTALHLMGIASLMAAVLAVAALVLRS
ncbi:MAG TPA: adenosylcobinamide-phosphate synthase CbiB [Nitrospiraceae bacterium]|nr:adenosylcobinamide-phosphate synthase CbiB [Nitrospiraceae bacterium]